MRRFSAPWCGEIGCPLRCVAMTQAGENGRAPDRATRNGSAHNFSIHHCALRYDTPANYVLASKLLVRELHENRGTYRSSRS